MLAIIMLATNLLIANQSPEVINTPFLLLAYLMQMIIINVYSISVMIIVRLLSESILSLQKIIIMQVPVFVLTSVGILLIIMVLLAIAPMIFLACCGAVAPTSCPKRPNYSVWGYGACISTTTSVTSSYSIAAGSYPPPVSRIQCYSMGPGTFEVMVQLGGAASGNCADVILVFCVGVAPTADSSPGDLVLCIVNDRVFDLDDFFIATGSQPFPVSRIQCYSIGPSASRLLQLLG